MSAPHPATHRSQARWRSRIVRSGLAPIADVQFNPRNWRIHPKAQQDALAGVLAEIGWVQQVVINARTGHLVDGHARVLLADRNGEAEVPAIWVDLSEEEEALVLATLDPLAALAGADAEQLDALLQEVSTEDAAVEELLESLADDARVARQAGGADRPPPSQTRPTVAAVVAVEDVATVERAIRQTGLRNRGEALVAICRAYLDQLHDGGLTEPLP